MDNTISLPQSEYSCFKGFDVANDNNQHHWNSAYIKQIVHERRIDEFFLTDTGAPRKRDSALALIGSFAGVVIPTILFSRKQNPSLKVDSIKNFFKLFDIEYELPQILTVGLGGVIGGLTGGLVDRKEKDKLQKMEEATFQVMNITFPALLVDASVKLTTKTKMLNNAVAKIALTCLSILVGAGTAVKVSNAVDDKFFDKYNHDPERKFKKKDLLIHVDDLLGSLILAKIPFAEKLHVNKILPLIYTWSGYHVGDA